ncbi:hypothetical protein MHK_003589 [Candidatus Magnetomorum sp. HK-1]|nr:hypothetical protein MHK_003589 [Candidatus Magnetomorum sp. HK-1]
MQEMDDFGETSDMKNSIIDIAIEYGLVTDYTSMIVVEETVFKSLNIDRRNQQRLKKEEAARTYRNSQTSYTSNRVDAQQPMFTKSRPTFSGGVGAMDPLSLMIFSPLLWSLRWRKNKIK